MYEDAGHRISEGTPAALVVDDFDTTVGEWAQSTTTVNHQQVLAQLMHLADTPTEAAGKTLRRAPVIVTGNDLSKVYPPLRRPGRMRPFPWLPTDDERHEVVAAILADVMDSTDVASLLAKLADAPIAFFSDLLVELLAVSADAEVRRQADDLKALTRNARRGREQLEKHVSKHKLTPAEIGEIALAAWHDRALATQSYLDNIDAKP
jgi:SpoVK/Ycf46/Vps4 family AAA+-type ATPase